MAKDEFKQSSDDDFEDEDLDEDIEEENEFADEGFE